ncbi:MAG: LLM class flavin-dependent oxidoreductase [Chelatococcus sp.]|nr:MAG: LLM class flavin-dependent oxidoreductase [Chelatococcus sp.]
MAIGSLGFLTPGNFEGHDPATGLERGLDLFVLGERLGYDSAWVRQRHLERGVSSAATFLAAATQRTRRIGLGTAVIQLGYENPFRLAEDLATVDALSHGRLQIGVSVGAPAHSHYLGAHFFDGHPDAVDFGYDRALRLRDNLRSPLLGGEDAVIVSPAGPQRPRLHPVVPGLGERLWYGGGSLRSAAWAGQNGFRLLTGNIVQGETSDRFFEAQQRIVETFLDAWSGPGAPQIALGRVIVPTDGADAASRRRYADYAQSRTARTQGPQGPKRTLFAPDLVGSADQILTQLRSDPILPYATAFRLELPYDFALGEYEQILDDVLRLVAPELGWRLPAVAA